MKSSFSQPIPFFQSPPKLLLQRLKTLNFRNPKIQNILSSIQNAQKNQTKLTLQSLVQNQTLTQNEANIISRFFILNGQKPSTTIAFDHSQSPFLNRLLESQFLIDLNQFQKNSILILPFLTPIQAQAIWNYKKNIQSFSSIYQLLLIPEIDTHTFLKLKPFLKPLPLKSIKNQNSLQIRYRYSLKPNQKNHYFYTRLSFKLDHNLSFFASGIKNENQSGYYPIALISQKISPFQLYRQYSLSLFFQNPNPNPSSPFSSWVLGDYSLQFGQHLVFGNPYSNIVDSIYSHPIKKSNRGIRPHSNPNRLGALRGIAISFPLGTFEFTFFAFINSFELHPHRFTQRNQYVNVSLNRLINDPSVISNHKNHSQKIFENGIGYNTLIHLNTQNTLGFNFAYLDFSHSIRPKTSSKTSSKTQNQSHFNGKQLLLSSLYADLNFSKSLNFYPEIALSYHKNPSKKPQFGFATSLGFQFHFHKSLIYSSLFRFLNPQFHSPHSSLVIQKRKNQIGLFQGLFFKPSKKLSSSLFFDFYKKISAQSFNQILNFKLKYKTQSSLLASYLLSFTKNYPNNHSHHLKIKNQINLEYFIFSYLSFKIAYTHQSFKNPSKPQKYLGQLFYIQSKSLILDFLQLILRFSFYDIQNFKASIYVVENQLFRWYQGIASYSSPGIAFNLSLKTSFHPFQLGFQFITRKYQTGPRKQTSKSFNKFLVQLIYRW